MPNAVIAHAPDGKFDLDALKKEAREWPGLDGMDLVPMVTSAQRFTWDETEWKLGEGYGRVQNGEFHVVAIDYGIKRNILRLLAGAAGKVTVVPATTSAQDILAMKPDGVFLSNGPGDPAATGEYAVPVIRQVVESGTPTFGICLGHQMLGLALGGKTMKMHQGHHGANHPVKDLTTGKVEITSMNHGFAVDKESLPDNVDQTHISLFDGSNCGLALKDRPVFSVQYHPEASPGPARQPLSVSALHRADARAQQKIGSRVLDPLSSKRDRHACSNDNRTHRVSICRRRRGAEQPAADAGLSRRDRRARHRRARSRRRSRRTAGATAYGTTASIRSRITTRRSTKCSASRWAARACASAAGTARNWMSRPGDVAVLPAGTGHQRISSTPDLLVIGAYPPDGHYDLCRGTSAEHARALETIPRVPLPQTDPLFGADGPLEAADEAVAVS